MLLNVQVLSFLLIMSKSRVYCSVFGCNSMRKRNPEISFHTFPRKGEEKVYVINKFDISELVDRHAVWVMKLKIGKPVTQFMKVCSRHFNKDDYFYRKAGSTSRQFLKKTAVPTLYLPSVRHGEIVKTVTTSSENPRNERAENRAKITQLLKELLPTSLLEHELPLLEIKEENLSENLANSTDLLETIKEEYLILDDPKIEEKTSSSDLSEGTIKTELTEIKQEVYYDSEAEEGEKTETNQTNEIHLPDKKYKFYVDGKSVCSLCCEVFLSPKQLEIHHQFVHVKKPSELTECKVPLIENTIDYGEIVYYCSLCSFKGYVLSCWKNHMKSHADNEYFTLISQDVQYVYENSKKIFQCKLCEFNCSRHSTMKTHVQRVHLGITKNHLCELCDKTFHTTQALKIHMRSHTGEKPYKCTECDYASSFRIDQHMKVHNKIKAYHCNVCEYKSPDSARLKLHMRTHTGEKPFKCLLCDYAATYKFSLVYHMKKKHTNAA